MKSQSSAREGHSDVPRAHAEPRAARLGEWLAAQRRAARAGALSDARRELLDEVRVAWRPQRALWDANCALLARYAARFNRPRDEAPSSKGGGDCGCD